MNLAGPWRARALLRRAVVLAAAVMLPVSAAQAEAPRAYRIGVLNEAWAANHPTVEGLKAGLRARGLAEGREVNFELHFTEGKSDELPREARALIKANVDLILTNNEAAALAARDATQQIPIVFTLVGNPVAAGIVSNLARPGGNLTGIAGGATQIVAKRIEILRTLVPKLRRVWFIYRAGDPIDAAAVTAADQAAKTLKVELVVRPVESAEQLKRTLLEVRPGDGLLAPEMDALDITAAILDKSLGTRVPAVFATAHWVARGGLISYGPDLYAQGVQAAAIVARILQGMRPQDVPVQAADDIALAINLETARLFALDVPRKILFRADVLQR
ncbi:MAG: ABC transporter substrate-binding protein [Betaproteobacteria bacterium]|nr:ABC transporter substrate-binding protein [Betaproteobacteria bacterium]